MAWLHNLIPTNVQSVLCNTVTISILFAHPGAAVAADQTYSFAEAVRHGVVDLTASPYAAVDPKNIIERLGELNPGLVNRIGFQYSGVTMKNLDHVASYAALIKQAYPRVRLGGGFPENLKTEYDEKLPCDGEKDARTFKAKDIGSKETSTGKYVWVDIARPAAQEYYICVGKLLITRGLSHLHFEESDNIVKQSSSAEEAIEGFKRVRNQLLGFAKSHDVELSFSGEPKLSQEMPLESVYLPSRFYIDKFDTQYHNRVENHGVGVGYTYVLSPKIVEDSIKMVPPRTKVFFYIDNFDYKQDDLRRFMELDAQNRRDLIVRSAEEAKKRGAIFVPSLNHCDGCVPAELVGDKCEVVEERKMSTYNAVLCGDMDAVRRALQIDSK